MKLEFLNNVNKGAGFLLVDAERLVRLFDFDTRQAGLLKDAIEETVIGRSLPLDLMDLEFIEPVNCTMTLVPADEDTGIAYVGNAKFTCSLTIGTFKKMTALIQPFTKKVNGYQWLYDLDTEIEFLFSPG